MTGAALADAYRLALDCCRTTDDAIRVFEAVARDIAALDRVELEALRLADRLCDTQAREAREKGER